jgi:hypothetical protein
MRVVAFAALNEASELVDPFILILSLSKDVGSRGGVFQSDSFDGPTICDEVCLGHSTREPLLRSPWCSGSEA